MKFLCRSFVRFISRHGFGSFRRNGGMYFTESPAETRNSWIAKIKSNRSSKIHFRYCHLHVNKYVKTRAWWMQIFVINYQICCLHFQTATRSFRAHLTGCPWKPLITSYSYRSLPTAGFSCYISTYVLDVFVWYAAWDAVLASGKRRT